MSELRRKIPRPIAALLRPLVNHLPIYSRATVKRHREEFRKLENDLQNAEVVIAQLSATVKESGGFVPPPLKLQKRVTNLHFDQFLASGTATIKDFERILRPTDRSLKSFDSILDFGVGCARVARPLRAYVGSAARIYATDIDREAIDWCRENYVGMAEFEANDPWPPLKYEDNSFDLIYCTSVFTHLPEDMQFKWLAELNRILKPQGYLILTTHGEAYYQHLSAERRAELESKGFLHFNNGLTPGLPDFYLTTFHTHDYLRGRWVEYLQLISIESRGILGRQDAILCTKKQM